MSNLHNAKSWLFVPANRPDFLTKSVSRGAHVIIVDMEDAVPEAEKSATRESLNASLAALQHAGQLAVLRVNAELENMVADLSCLDINNLEGVMLPKLDSADWLQLVDGYLTRLELAQGKSVGSTQIIGLIESPKAVRRVAEIATASQRLCCLAVGSEDLSLSMGIAPTQDGLAGPMTHIILAAKEAHVGVLSVAGSLAEFRDLVAYEQQVVTAAAMGCTGALCIHPAQIPIVNQHYGPSNSQVVWANKVLDTVAANPNAGVWQVDGAMVDAPVVARAQAIIQQSSGDN